MKKEKNITNTIQDIMPFMSKSINDLLVYELQIELKKRQKKPLSQKEQIFDKYFVKPSTMINHINKRFQK